MQLLAGNYNILVLHSYHQGMSWTDDITKGINSFFSDKPVNLHYEYLDTKRNISEEYFQNLRKLYSLKHRYIRFDAIIACDNNALKFINDGYLTSSGSSPVIFCGVNNFSRRMISRLKDVSGITEEEDFESNIKMILKIHPDLKDIYVITDNRTATAVETKKVFMEAAGKLKPGKRIIFMENFPLDILLKKIRMIPPSGSVIFMLNFNKDINHIYISNEDAIELVSENSPVPAYGTWNFFLGHGITGGIIITGFDQGLDAAKITWDVINHKNSSFSKITRSRPGKAVFDFNMLKKYGISTSNLPDNSTIINRPEKPSKKYLKALMILFIILLLFITVFLINRRIYLIKQEKLQKEQDRLRKEIDHHTLELKKNLNDREKLLSAIGHDLRSPLINILSMIKLFNMRNSRNNDETGHLMKVLQLSTEPVLELLDNLLYWGQNSMNGIKPEIGILDLNELLKRTVDIFTFPLEYKGIKLTVNVENKSSAVGDKNIIQLVVRNLISNSVKYTQHGGNITVSAVSSDNLITISVCDSGTGFPAETIELIKHSNSVKSTKGTFNEKGMGMGLILCRDLLRLHDTALHVRNNETAGACVSFSLPSSKQNLL